MLPVYQFVNWVRVIKLAYLDFSTPWVVVQERRELETLLAEAKEHCKEMQSKLSRIQTSTDREISGLCRDRNMATENAPSLKSSAIVVAMIPSIRQWTWYILNRLARIVVGVRSLVRRMAKLTDDAEYDAGETSENVPSPLSDAGNHDNYYGRRL
ncbi:unnamed protein product [Protopolystoma xenopodis]|uniref:Uncharacterized protein n=1 Tax=Protopolystoma xenopodis TaxID=117903 RepID=A0A3S5AG91_9PLAT|nr:unnamed protein product [Protopolystoma xenopodis]